MRIHYESCSVCWELGFINGSLFKTHLSPECDNIIFLSHYVALAGLKFSILLDSTSQMLKLQ